MAVLHLKAKLVVLLLSNLRLYLVGLLYVWWDFTHWYWHSPRESYWDVCFVRFKCYSSL